MSIPFLSDIILKKGNKIQFTTDAGANAGTIDTDSNGNLVFNNTAGDILLGDGSSDVFIGDGTNNVDIIFEQSGAIKGDGSSVTLTLGGANTTLNLENPNINGQLSLSNKLTFTGANGYILFDYEPSTGSNAEYTNEVPLLKVDHAGTEKTVLSRLTNNGALAIGIDDTVAIVAGDTKSVFKANHNYAAEEVVFVAEGGFRAYGFPNNDTSWSNRNEFRFRSDSTTANDNGLYLGDGSATQFIDISRNLKNIGTINSSGNADIGGQGIFGAKVTVNTNSDDILTLNQLSGSGTKWNYINFNQNGTREWFIGQDTDGNFDLYNDVIDQYAITVNRSNNSILLNDTVTVAQALTITTGDVTLSNGNVIVGSQYGVRFNDANTRIYTNTDSPEDLLVEADQDLLLMPDNNVGVGTSSPAHKLDVAGVIKGTSSIRVDAGSPFFGLYNSGAEKAYLQWTQSSNQLTLQSDGDTRFLNGGEAMRIKAGASKIGIGTDDPLTRLHIAQVEISGATNTTFGHLMVEDTDAQIDLVSTESGTWGSAINFKEHNTSNASLNDIWSIARNTTGGQGDSGLYFNFGTSNQHDNSNKIKFTSGGNIVAAGTVTANGTTLTGDQDLSSLAPKASPTFTGVPAAPTASAGTNTTQLATTAFVSTAVSNLVGSAPGTLDTLQELGDALGDDPNFATTITTSIGTKVSKSGGDTITSGGNIGLTINHNDFNKGLVIHRNHNDNSPSITFKNNQEQIGILFAQESDDNLYWRQGTNTTNRKIWHTANDGSGSGLDADLLDGQHGTHYLNYANFTGTVPTWNQNTTGSAASATTASTANNLQGFDDRDIAPEDLSFSDDLKLFFAEKTGIEGGTVGTDYQDLLVFSSYVDSSGGNLNALALDKSTHRILHYNATHNATNWGTPKELAYASEFVKRTGGTSSSMTGDLHIISGGPKIYLQDNTDDDDQAIIFRNNGGSDEYKIATQDFTSAATGDGLFIGSETTDPLKLVTNDTIALSIDSSQIATFASDIALADSKAIKLGSGGTFQLWHQSGANGNSFIDEQSTGELYIRSNSTIRLAHYANNTASANFNPAGAVELYHNTSKKFETTSTGVKTTGTRSIFAVDTVANSFSGTAAVEVYANQEDSVLMVHQDDGNHESVLHFRTGGNDTKIIVPPNTRALQIDTETTTDALMLNPDGHLTLASGITATNTSFSGTMNIAGGIYHIGDTNTFFGFVGGNDTFTIDTGGSQRLDVNNAGVRFGGAGARIVTVKDEDDMAANSNVALATQQSIKTYVDNRISNLVDSAPAALNTLDELAEALGDDAAFSTTVTTALGNRVRFDTASQGLSSTQKANARGNIGAGTSSLSLGTTSTTALAGNTQTISSTEQQKLAQITVTQSVNLDTMESGISTNTSNISSNTTNITSNNVIANAALPKAGGVITGNIDNNDDVEFRMGASRDLKIYHDSSGSGTNYIDNVGKALVITGTHNSSQAEAISVTASGAQVFLSYNGGFVFNTKSGGVAVNGSIDVTGTVDGVDIAARDAVLTSTTTLAGGAIQKTGGTMTGLLTLSGQPTQNNHAATRQYASVESYSAYDAENNSFDFVGGADDEGTNVRANAGQFMRTTLVGHFSQTSGSTSDFFIPFNNNNESTVATYYHMWTPPANGKVISMTMKHGHGTAPTLASAAPTRFRIAKNGTSPTYTSGYKTRVRVEGRSDDYYSYIHQGAINFSFSAGDRVYFKFQNGSSSTRWRNCAVSIVVEYHIN